MSIGTDFLQYGPKSAPKMSSPALRTRHNRCVIRIRRERLAGPRF